MRHSLYSKMFLRHVEGGKMKTLSSSKINWHFSPRYEFSWYIKAVKNLFHLQWIWRLKSPFYNDPQNLYGQSFFAILLDFEYQSKTSENVTEFQKFNKAKYQCEQFCTKIFV